MRGFQPGDRVGHPRYGIGTVLALSAARRIRVRFDRQRLLPRTVRVHELSSAERTLPPDQAGEVPGSVRPETSTPASAPTGGGARAVRLAAGVDRLTRLARLRQTVDALRLGVVPSDHVADYTVGRTQEVQEVRRRLTAGQGLRLIWGEYGTGKTHLLDMFEQLARHLGYVTARTVLDPFEVQPSHPQRLYAAIARSLRYPGQAGGGLEPLLQALENSSTHLQKEKRRFSRFLSPTLFAQANGDPETLALAVDYAEGQPVDTAVFQRILRRAGWRGPPPLALSDYRTYGRIYVHIVGTLATWSRDAGFRGLLLLFDEIERLDALNAAHRRFALEVLKHYAAATLPPKQLAFTEAELYRGGHEIHRRLPLRYRANQPLVVLMALTPLRETQAAIRHILADHSQELSIRPLGALELGQLVDRVMDLYRRAYPEFQPQPYQLEPIRELMARRAEQGEDRPREVVRGVVSGLDALRYGLGLTIRLTTSRRPVAP
jgi:hypothetical protein